MLRTLWPRVALGTIFVLCLTCLETAFAAASTSVPVNPTFGNDHPTCNVSSPCKTIAYAVQQLRASTVNLSAGVFNETTINISGMPSLVIRGALGPALTIFDCSRRSNRSALSGAALNIMNSSVSITGVTFLNCVDANSRGGAVSAVGSSVSISFCAFVNCSAASGGAMSVSGPGSDLVLSVQNSTFSGNSATGSCPAVATQPCSTWGGAIAAFEMLNVVISGCTMVNNIAQASVPSTSLQSNSSSNAVAGGGCVSVLFSGNTSGSSVIISSNTFAQCTVTVSAINGVRVGNGMRLHVLFCSQSIGCCLSHLLTQQQG